MFIMAIFALWLLLVKSEKYDQSTYLEYHVQLISNISKTVNLTTKRKRNECWLYQGRKEKNLVSQLENQKIETSKYINMLQNLLNQKSYDLHVLALARRAVSNLNKKQGAKPLASQAPAAPIFESKELYGVIPTDTRKPFDVREIITRLVDGSAFRRVQSPLWQHPGVRLCPRRGHAGGHHRQQRHFVQRIGAERARTSSSCAASATFRWRSCRTSPASWWAASTKTRASPATAPSWSRRWPRPACPNSPSSLAAALAPATTACAAAPTAHASCGRGPTRASARWVASRPPACWPPSSATASSPRAASGARKKKKPSKPRSASSTKTRATPTTPPPGCGTTA